MPTCNRPFVVEDASQAVLLSQDNQPGRETRTVDTCVR
jgi:hypothetical protein